MARYSGSGADTQCSKKVSARDGHGVRSRPPFVRLLRSWSEGPRKDVLRGSSATGAGSEADVGSVASDGGRDVDGPRSGECFRGSGRVSYGQGQCRTVVGYLRLHDVATGQSDAATHSSSWDSRNGTVDVKASGIVAFSGVVMDIEFNGNARGHTSVTETASASADCGRTDVLDSEGEAVGVGVRELEREGRGERLDVDRSIPEGAGHFVVRGGVGHQQLGAAELGVPVKLHACGGEARGEVNGRSGTGLDGVGGRGDGAGGESRGGCHSIDGLGTRDGDGAGVKLSRAADRGAGLRTIQGVED